LARFIHSNEADLIERSTQHSTEKRSGKFLRKFEIPRFSLMQVDDDDDADDEQLL